MKILCFVISLWSLASCGRIFVILPVVIPSHMNLYEPVIIGLAERKHDIVLATPMRMKITHERVKQYVLPTSMAIFRQYLTEPLTLRNEPFPPIKTAEMYIRGTHVCQRLNQEIVEHVPQQNEEFDLVLTGAFLMECSFGYIDKHKTPFVLLMTSPWPNYHRMSSNYMTFAYNPHVFLHYTDKMNFIERTINTLFTIAHLVWLNYMAVPSLEKSWGKFFDNNASSDVISNNVSLILTSSEITTGFNKPTGPKVVDVGCIHCKNPKPLPQELESFIEESGELGFIFASLGSALTESPFVRELQKKLVRAFSMLPQKVIWKMAGSIDYNIPKNVKAISWAPQQDILGHPKIKAFLSQGGIYSLQEAVYHAVPTVTLPIWMDQDQNAAMAVQRGISVKLDITDFTSEELVDALTKVINDTSYFENVRKLSAVIKDKPLAPLDSAMFWIEHVMRHGGGLHLTPASQDLSTLELYMVDITAALLLLITIASIVGLWTCIKFVALVKMFLRLCTTKKNK